MPAAAPVRGGKTGYGTNGATAPAGGSVAAGPGPAAERGLCRVPGAPGGGGAPAGAAGPTGNPSVPATSAASKTRFQLYLAATVANLTLVASKAGMTGEPGSGPSAGSPQVAGMVQFRHRMARANLDPLPARIGLTDQIPLPNKGFPSGFLGKPC